MSKIYASFQCLASWLKEDNKEMIEAVESQLDKQIGEALEEGKREEVKNTIMVALKRMPECGGYIGGRLAARM
jgi:hypothetical protein